MSGASPRAAYTRPHDPQMCDYVVVETQVGGEVSSTKFALVEVPAAADAFDDSETNELPLMTFVGQGMMPRPPARR